MEELLLIAIAGLLVVLVVVTVVGHGIWLMLAAIVRVVRGQSSRRTRGTSDYHWETCPGCGEPVAPTQRRCDACYLSLDSPTAAELRDLQHTRRQLRRFRDAGVLDDATYERLRQECMHTQERLRRGLAAPARPEEAPARLRRHADKPVRSAEPEEVTLEAIPVMPLPLEPSPAAEVAETTPPAEPPRRRRSLGEVLTAFMEERNILWGELVGGLLIVGCSIALVISLWHTLGQIAYFPFLILAAITAALLGAGLYTLHRWKLESTSRGLLVIGLLLVPLNFTVLAQVPGTTATTILGVAVELAAVAAFTAVAILAARAVLPGQRWLLTAALLGPAAAQLLVPHLLAPGEISAGPFLLLAALPVACYLLTTGLILYRTRQQLLEDLRAQELFGFLGLAAFALAAALAFLVYHTGDLSLALRRLALPVALAGVPVLASGLLVFRGPEGLSAAWRTVGSAVALMGMAILLAALPLAWTQPETLLVVCLVDFAILTTVAVAFRLPPAHAAALLGLVVAYLTGFHLVFGNLNVSAAEVGKRLLQQALTTESGSALIVLVAGVCVVSELFVRMGRRGDGLCYAAAAGAMAVASLLLVCLGGMSEPGRAALTFGCYAALGLALNLRWQQLWVAYAALVLVLAATLWGLQWAQPGPQPLWALVVAAESVALAGLAVLANVANPRWMLPRALSDVAAVAAALALGVACVAPSLPRRPRFTPEPPCCWRRHPWRWRGATGPRR